MFRSAPWHAWGTTLRVGESVRAIALPLTIHKVLPDVILRRVKSFNLLNESSKVDVDEDLVLLLHQVRLANTLLCDVRLSMALQDLQVVSKQLSAQQNIAKFRSAAQTFLDDKDGIFSNNEPEDVLGSLPEHPGVIMLVSPDDVKKGVMLAWRVASLCLMQWPHEKEHLRTLNVALRNRVTIAELDRLEAELKTTFDESVERRATFNDLFALQSSLETLNNLASTPLWRMKAEGSLSSVRSLMQARSVYDSVVDFDSFDPCKVKINTAHFKECVEAAEAAIQSYQQLYTSEGITNTQTAQDVLQQNAGGGRSGGSKSEGGFGRRVFLGPAQGGHCGDLEEVAEDSLGQEHQGPS